MKSKLRYEKERLVGLGIWCCFIMALQPWPVGHVIAAVLAFVGMGWMTEQLYFWKRWALRGYRQKQLIEQALNESGLKMVYTCPQCKQDVTDPEEHTRKIHSKEKTS